MTELKTQCGTQFNTQYRLSSTHDPLATAIHT